MALNLGVDELMRMAGGSVGTVMLAGLVLGFFVVLGRAVTPPAARSLRTALAGVRRLQELHHRNAIAPWDDLDKHFPRNRNRER